MRDIDLKIEECLTQVAQRWGRLRFFQYSANLGSVVLLVVLLLGVGIVYGWLTDKGEIVTWLERLAFGAIGLLILVRSSSTMKRPALPFG